MNTLSLKDLYYKPSISGYPSVGPEKIESEGDNFSLNVSISGPFDGMPENYFTWPEAQIVARYWTEQCTAVLKKDIETNNNEARRFFKIQEIIGKEAYNSLLAELKAGKEKYEKEGLWIHGYSTPPMYFAEALIEVINSNKDLLYEEKPVQVMIMPEIPKAASNIQINPKLSDDQDLTSIKRCIACGSDNISVEEEKGGFLWLSRFKTISCAICGTKFRKEIGDADGWHLFTSEVGNKVWDDYQFQELTAREWVAIGNGGLSDQKQRVIDVENWLGRLSEGTLRVSFRGVDTPVMLKPSEEILFALPDVTLKEPRAVRKSSGGYAGPSFRVAKGVYFRMGRFGSSSESHQEIRDIDRGILTVTGERLIFSGNMKTVNVDLRKIVQIDPFTDGLALHREGREKTQYFVWDENIGRIQLSEGERKYAEPISGMIVKCVMEGAIRNHNKPRG